MRRNQFRVLYRQFLASAVDLELVSSGASVNTLLGQFGGLLIFIGAGLGYVALLTVGGGMPPGTRVNFNFGMEHFLVATTMLVAGVFGVLNWDSAFPSRRDVFVLGPLPVRPGTLFLAKVAASMAALGVSIGAIHFLIGIIFPFSLTPPGGGILDLFFALALYRALGAYWLTMLAAGAFTFWCILGIQGITAHLLARRYFPRVSAVLQIGVFCTLVCVYFLEPSLSTPRALAAAGNQRDLARLPSYWFLALFQELLGSRESAIISLAGRAWTALAIAGLGTAVTYLLSYFRTLRRIVEEPDILPASSGRNWLPRFGDAYQTVVAQFSIRTLIRSRQHRVILAFYLGMGCALLILFGRAPAAQQQLSLAARSQWPQVTLTMLALSLVVTCLWIAGMRVVFAMPIDLRANWVFRIAPLGGATACLAARRRTFLAMGVAPVWSAWAIFFLCVWPRRPAIEHVALLGLIAILLSEVCLSGMQKIPFTCSYLPGKLHVHMAIVGAMVLWIVVLKSVEFEKEALESPFPYYVLLCSLAIAIVAVRQRNTAAAQGDGGGLMFEELPEPAVMVLGLDR